MGHRIGGRVVHLGCAIVETVLSCADKSVVGVSGVSGVSGVGGGKVGVVVMVSDGSRVGAGSEVGI